jgi:histidyl-tRNA synthetase
MRSAFLLKGIKFNPSGGADRPQKGRYREFYQCDADVVGTNSLICEAEIILMIKEVFKSLGIKTLPSRSIIGVSFLESLNRLAQKKMRPRFFVAIDKLDKIGEEKVRGRNCVEKISQTKVFLHCLKF